MSIYVFLFFLILSGEQSAQGQLILNADRAEVDFQMLLDPCFNNHFHPRHHPHQHPFSSYTHSNPHTYDSALQRQQPNTDTTAAIPPDTARSIGRRRKLDTTNIDEELLKRRRSRIASVHDRRFEIDIERVIDRVKTFSDFQTYLDHQLEQNRRSSPPILSDLWSPPIALPDI